MIGFLFRKRVLAVCILALACFLLAEIFPKHSSPVIKTEIIENSPGFSFAHAATIAEVPSGLVAAWYGRAQGRKETVFVSRLERNSNTWTAAVALVAQDQRGRPEQCWNPVLFQQNKGPLFLFYKTGKGPNSWKGKFSVSYDGGKSWETPCPLPDGILGPAKNKPIEFGDGTILFPSSAESPQYWKIFIEYIRPAGIEDFSAREKWSIIGPLNTCRVKVIQPAFLDFGAGKIIMLARNLRSAPFFQSIMEARSADRGLTWTAFTSSGLSNPNSGIDATVLKDGRAIVVYNPNRFVRTPLAIAVSLNQGSSWIPCGKLESGFGEFSYPSVIQASDGKIHVVYTWQRKNIKHAVVDPALLPAARKLR